jgi:hypothetical protein
MSRISLALALFLALPMCARGAASVSAAKVEPIIENGIPGPSPLMGALSIDGKQKISPTLASYARKVWMGLVAAQPTYGLTDPPQRKECHADNAPITRVLYKEAGRGPPRR